MKGFFKKFETDMAAASFAEAGEFETARDIMREGKNSNKKVLLGTEGAGVDHKAFRYAVNICRRLGAGLEILHVMDPETPGDGGIKEELAGAKWALGPVFESLRKEGIDYVLNFGAGRLEEEVAQYAGGRRDILFVVVEKPEGATSKKGRLQKGLSDALERLGCPLVVVSSAMKV